MKNINNRWLSVALITGLTVLIVLDILVWNRTGESDWALIYSIILMPIFAVFLLHQISGHLGLAIVLSIGLSAVSQYLVLVLFFPEDPMGSAIAILFFLLRSGVAVATGVFLWAWRFFRATSPTSAPR